MGLYMNKTAHPDVFMNQGQLKEPNQGYFKIDYFAEMISAQKRINDSLTNAYQDLRTLYHKQQQTQTKEWKDIGHELGKLKESNQQHMQFEQHVREGFNVLEESNEKLYQKLEEEGLLKQEIIDDMKHIRESNQVILNQIGDHESLNQELTAKMDDLMKLQETMADSISNQREDQHKTLHSLENQDALLEKTLRQVTNLRSVLFERTSYLAEKVESSYKLTSSFIYNALSDSDQPLAFRIDQKMAEQEQHKS